MRLSTICLSFMGAGLLAVVVGQATLSAQPAAESAEVDSPPALSLASPVQGLVRPSQQVTLRSPLNELLDELHVAEGDAVEQGEPLVELDRRQQAMAVEAARFEAESEARLRKARLMVEEAVFSLEQVENLAEKDVAGEWEVRRARLQKRQAEADYELAEERIEQARLQYELQRTRLERYTIKAPFAGVVHRIQAEPGALLSGDQEILHLIALDPLHAVVHMPVGVYGELREGGRYRLRAGSPVNETLVGELITVSPVLDPASESFRCVFEIPNPDARLPVGFTVELIGAAEGM
ncbi:MAG: efflux RND transporter periplasmic adaptor subunit [Phycisphaeraceae bacterium]